MFHTLMFHIACNSQVSENMTACKKSPNILLPLQQLNGFSFDVDVFQKKKRLRVSGIPRKSGGGRDLGCGNGIGTG